MKYLVKAPGILWKIGMFGLLDIFFPHEIFRAIFLLYFFWFLDPLTWTMLRQLAGNFRARRKYGDNLPSKENYTCKADYILPFIGKWYVANGGADKELSHSWGMLPQRYAYDFLIIDDEGGSAVIDANSAENYHCYGKDVLAPADGVVVRVSSRHKDSRVNGAKIYCDTWDINGNFITIKHTACEYSHICHLAPDSIAVAKGDTVKQGQLIAKCGNTGNTSQPHIHYQLQSGKSAYSSAGLPIAFVNVKAHPRADYGKIDNRTPQGKAEQAMTGGRIYISRGLEVENGEDHNLD